MYMVTPTKKQRIMLDFIDGFVKGNGFSPTLREVMQALGYKSVSTVAKHVDNLIVRGWLVKRDGEARSLEVVSESTVSALELDSSSTHRAWLFSQIKKIQDKGMTEDDALVISRALEILGIDNGEDTQSI